MATRKTEKKPCACDLDKAIAEFKKSQEADASEQLEAQISQKSYNYAILTSVILNIILSIIVLYVISDCGNVCHGKP